MKINTKHIGLCLLLGAAMSTTSCNDLLDLDPVSQITRSHSIHQPISWLLT